jgi:hypothetical protein
VISLPATTGFGDAMFVTVISACEVVPTTLDAIAVLFAEFGSLVEELAVAVLVNIVPLATPVFTLTIIEKLAVVLPAIVSVLQTTFPVAPLGGVQVQPDGAAIEAKVVFAGTVSTIVALSAALGPLLVRIGVKISEPPTTTGSGEAESVTLRSALETTAATSVALSFARFSSPPPLTYAVFVSVEGAVCKTFAFTVSDG